MAEKCTWIVFRAHSHRIREEDDELPDYHGVFVCPDSRREPEKLLEDVLAARKLYVTEIIEQREMNLDDYWGRYDRLKVELDIPGYGVSLTKLVRGVIPGE